MYIYNQSGSIVVVLNVWRFRISDFVVNMYKIAGVATVDIEDSKYNDDISVARVKIKKGHVVNGYLLERIAEFEAR